MLKMNELNESMIFVCFIIGIVIFFFIFYSFIVLPFL